MPIYEYVCKTCGHELESLQSMSEDPLTDCPECGRPDLKRKISAASFRLKGGGWYETDFKKDKRRNVAGEGEGKSSEKSDAKPDTKADSKSGKTTGSDKSTGSGKTAKPDGGAKSGKSGNRKAASGD